MKMALQRVERPTDAVLRARRDALVEVAGQDLVELDDVVRVDVIPVLGTGKTDYKVLRRIVTDRVEAKGKQA